MGRGSGNWGRRKYIQGGLSKGGGKGMGNGMERREGSIVGNGSGECFMGRGCSLKGRLSIKGSLRRGRYRRGRRLRLSMRMVIVIMGLWIKSLGRRGRGWCRGRMEGCRVGCLGKGCLFKKFVRCFFLRVVYFLAVEKLMEEDDDDHDNEGN